MSDMIHITMLGGFSIRRGDNRIDDSSNRMKKVWLLLAYLIYTRNTHTTQNNFLSLLRGAGNEEIDDPAENIEHRGGQAAGLYALPLIPAVKPLVFSDQIV